MLKMPLYQVVVMSALMLSGLAIQGCQGNTASPLGQTQMVANTIAETDFDEPVNQPALELIEDFVRRVEKGQPIADLLTPSIIFTFNVVEPCAAVISIRLNNVDAQAMDDGFGFDAHYEWQNPDCTPPGSIPVWIDFTLSNRVAAWTKITAAADDHNFEAFYIAPESSTESLFVHLSPTDNGPKISQIEFKRAHDPNGKSELE